MAPLSLMKVSEAQEEEVEGQRKEGPEWLQDGVKHSCRRASRDP